MAKLTPEELQDELSSLEEQGAGPNDLKRFASEQGYNIEPINNAQPRPLLQAAKQGVMAGLLGPMQATQGLAKNIGQNPEQAFERYGMSLPIVGGAIMGPAAPIGAALGETARQAIGTAIGSKSVPTSRAGIAANVIGQGVAANPAILSSTLSAIPGVGKALSSTGEVMSSLAEKFGKGTARAIKTLTGLPENDVIQGFKQGYSTYVAPSMERAQDIFRGAMKQEGLTGEVPIEDVFDAGAGRARDTAVTAAKKMATGQQLTAEEALNARQATDRVIEATPVKDKIGRGRLFEYRNKFDDALSQVSGPLENASNQYRQAVVRNKFLEPFRLTRSGAQSAVTPLLSMLKSGGAAALPIAATSPALYGAGITTAGQALKTGSALAGIPAIRQIGVNIASLLWQRKQERDKQSQ